MKLSWLDFYSAGVPALDYFLMQVEDLKKLADGTPAERGVNITAELCIIGLAAYFESFCKSEFAAIINICPATLRRFSDRRECRINAKNLLHVIADSTRSLGFLVSEEYDFGSAKSVNSLFQDLLNITPFSKKEAAKYADFLNDRNLLVHHGGVYTAKYKGQFAAKGLSGGKIYFDSLEVGKQEVREWASFLVSVANKLGGAARSALSDFAVSQELKIDPERKLGVEALGPELNSSTAMAAIAEIESRLKPKRRTKSHKLAKATANAGPAPGSSGPNPRNQK